jgi:hypothetical protein
MRKPLNLDKLKSQPSELHINGKTYEVSAVPLALLIKITKIFQDKEGVMNEKIIKGMDVVGDIILLENEDFDKKELDTLEIHAAMKLMEWIIGTGDQVKEEVKKK